MNQSQYRVTSSNLSISQIQRKQGLGDVVAKVSKSVGIQPCGGCKKRQQALNDWWFKLTDKLGEVFKDGSGSR
jgi:hypothetical protein